MTPDSMNYCYEATPADPLRGEKYFISFEKLGSEIILEKCQGTMFKRPEKGLKLKMFGHVTCRIVVWIVFRVFQTVFRIKCKKIRGSFVLQACRPNKLLL